MGPKIAEPGAWATHTTCNEIEFLDALGTHCGRSSKKTKRELLQAYLDTIYSRRWDSGVSIVQVFNHAEKLLGMEIRRGR